MSGPHVPLDTVCQAVVPLRTALLPPSTQFPRRNLEKEAQGSEMEMLKHLGISFSLGFGQALWSSGP